MMITTAPSVGGKNIIKTLSLVRGIRGNTVRARNLARDIFVLAKNVVGGEIKEYTPLVI